MSYYCDPCSRWFVSFSSLRQHVETSSKHQSHYCDDCNKEFNTQAALTKHYIRSSRHAYCQFCDEHFDDESDLDDHNDDEHWRCSPCDELFDTEEDRDEHMEEFHWYCKSCDRIFGSEQSLDMHLRTSKIHNKKIYRCPGRGCGKSFVAYGDLALHLESGACSSGATRRAINNLVARADRNNLITNPSRLIGYDEKARVVSTSANSSAWNGRQYECFLCHKEFRQLSSLNAHLHSPVHDQKIYRCPKGYKGCGAEYKTLSGLLDDVTGRMGRLTF